MSVGNAVLFRLRTELGLTQKQMAETCGLAKVYIAQVEGGTYHLGRDAGLKILDAYRTPMRELGIELEDLLRGASRAA
jgi:transcriptional regulator with XRE-family HTH domain